MAIVLTIISIISGAASIISLLLQLFSNSRGSKIASSMLAIFAIIFSFYMLVIPGSAPVEKVSSKFRYFQKLRENDTLIQQGTFSFSGQKVYTIEFEEPYKNIPKVDVLNIHGYANGDVPLVDNVTNLFFQVRRWGSSRGDWIPTGLQEYKWVAEGTPYSNK
jgi:hypothetical protein